MKTIRTTITPLVLEYTPQIPFSHVQLTAEARKNPQNATEAKQTQRNKIEGYHKKTTYYLPFHNTNPWYQKI